MAGDIMAAGLAIDLGTGRCQNYFTALCGGMRCHGVPFDCGDRIGASPAERNPCSGDPARPARPHPSNHRSRDRAWSSIDDDRGRK